MKKSRDISRYKMKPKSHRLNTWLYPLRLTNQNQRPDRICKIKWLSKPFLWHLIKQTSCHVQGFCFLKTSEIPLTRIPAKTVNAFYLSSVFQRGLQTVTAREFDQGVKTCQNELISNSVKFQTRYLELTWKLTTKINQKKLMFEKPFQR